MGFNGRFATCLPTRENYSVPDPFRMETKVSKPSFQGGVYTVYMEFIDIIGIGSAALTLTAFVGNEWGKLDAESLTYDLLNLIASIGLFLRMHTTRACCHS